MNFGTLQPLLTACLLACALPTHAFDLQAHRGGRGLAPENTLAAFGNALDIGVDTLELDIGLTSDDTVVISHDTSLNPDHTRDAKGAWLTTKGPTIRSLPLAQLQTYDVGRINADSAYGKQFAAQRARDGERIPTLGALFTQVRSVAASEVRFNIETKIDPTLPAETASPEAIVKALLAVIAQSDMAGRVTIQSFDWRTLALVGQMAPSLPRAYLTSTRTLRDSRWTSGLVLDRFGSVPQLVKAAAGSSGAAVVWSPSFGDLTQDQVKEAHSLGLGVLPWTVNQREDMVRLMDWGVDGIITDYPDVLRDLMRERGLPLPKALKH
ncbi:glycerophosphodiester phosphodiesterase [Variovorax sp. J22R133]|uniref:glycerophosphodiester phosphodiesterase n=1 Tax=Variovorax brevis TaxID=3053503 RepID=UPI002577CB9C|nr:glycerophosphodiester phosphodiesterase [Variovorax sp. J22R133]MDM0113120.1 glycerophosphodiester phosphodiesterase [Variovorax sp. J22R133]